ncbi:MAG: NCS1 family nucleobase:cation symporter-1 [Bacteroidales bacterium]|jgi:NCS1 family nucleobase:cation symporter-1|nr:NCS1 family nucleobase:cation symporter-1 [Bacteroidales bacterium]
MDNQIIELTEDISASPLYSSDLAPVPASARTWNKWHIASIWVGMAVCIPTYMLASSLVEQGMNWWQALITILLGNLIVLAPMILNAHVGTKYGVPLPVFLRLSFGVQGSILASLFRGLVACGWFGIQTWIGGAAIYQLLLTMLPDLASSAYLGDFVGLNLAQASCFMFFWAINMWVVYKGIDSIKVLETWSAPFLLLIGLFLLVWAWYRVGSMSDILDASYTLSGNGNVNFWKIFFPGLTAMVGFWATLSLNIPDFTRYARTQKDQVLGQIIGLPTTMVFYSFIGIAVTSATLLIYGKAIWDPVALLGKFDSPIVVAISMFGLTIATLSTNIAANVVAPANSFANIAPRIISFKMGGYITGIIGILIFPWKLIADPEGYIFRWLIAYSALLGALAGVMICDYYLIRKTNFDLAELFKVKGKFKGWNNPAWIAFTISILPVIPGFLVAVGLSPIDYFPEILVSLYSYAWFVTFAISFLVYWMIMKKEY